MNMALFLNTLVILLILPRAPFYIAICLLHCHLRRDLYVGTDSIPYTLVGWLWRVGLCCTNIASVCRLYALWEFKNHPFFLHLFFSFLLFTPSFLVNQLFFYFHIVRCSNELDLGHIFLPSGQNFDVFLSCDVDPPTWQTGLAMFITICQSLTWIGNKMTKLCNHCCWMHQVLYAETMKGTVRIDILESLYAFVNVCSESKEWGLPFEWERR